MDESRRDFLKKAGFVTLGLGAGLPVIGAATRALTSASAVATPSAIQWGMIINLKKCQDPAITRACIDACHTEHNVPVISNKDEEIKWIWTEPFHNVFFDQVHSRMTEAQHKTSVMVLCNHCTSPSCVRVCPTQATWKNPKTGIVMMDMHRCIGCRYCMAACPYGSRSFNFSDPRKHLAKINTTYPTRTKGVVEKCDFCSEKLRLDPSALPTCVETANRIAGEPVMFFGNVNDPKSEISRILSETPTMCRRPSLGTRPNVFYIV